MYVPRYFKEKELVPIYMIKIFRLKDINPIMLFSEYLLRSIDFIREMYGAITINTKDLQFCGLRPLYYEGNNNFSAHKLGKAFDLHIVNIENEASKIKLEEEKNIQAILSQNKDREDLLNELNEIKKERKMFKTEKYNEIRENLLQVKELEKLNFENNVSWIHTDILNRKNRLFNA